MAPRAILIAALLAGGCKHEKARSPCELDAGSPSGLELRDQNGALELSVRGSGSVCDGANRLIARLKERPPVAAVENLAGDVQASIDSSDATLTIRADLLPRGDAGACGSPLRLYERGGLLRILDAEGVPKAQIDWHDERAVAYDPAGTPIAYANVVDGKTVVHARDGAVRHYLGGHYFHGAAAAFALEMFPIQVRLLLARYLDSHYGRSSP